MTDRYSIQRLPPEAWDWERMDAYPDRVIFQTREWLAFVADAQTAEPVIAAVRSGTDTVGFFTGLLVRRFGIRILGSPFPGWTTSSMGFNLEEGASRREAAVALVRFAFGSLGCMHLELKDRLLGVDDVAGLGFRFEPTVTFEVDLASEEDLILGRMSSACRRAIRKSEKVGVQVEVASPAGFAEEYHAQLADVFAKQALVPTYGVDRVGRLIEHLHPTGRLLLLRARGPDRTSLATGIFPAFNRTAYFWGGASWRSGQIHRPNEAIFWYAMRYWRERGVTVLDMGGGGDYKRKYAPTEHSVPFFRVSRVRGLELLRDAAQRARSRSQERAGRGARSAAPDGG